MGMAECAPNDNMMIQRGTIISPPPIPPTLERAAKKIMANVPPTTCSSNGNKSSWTHISPLQVFRDLQSEFVSQDSSFAWAIIARRTNTFKYRDAICIFIIFT